MTRFALRACSLLLAAVHGTASEPLLPGFILYCHCSLSSYRLVAVAGDDILSGEYCFRHEEDGGGDDGDGDGDADGGAACGGDDDQKEDMQRLRRIFASLHLYIWSLNH